MTLYFDNLYFLSELEVKWRRQNRSTSRLIVVKIVFEEQKVTLPYKGRDFIISEIIRNKFFFENGRIWKNNFNNKN